MLQVRKLVLAVAAATSMASGMAHALGLGEVSVKSALNEPLVAEVELLEVGGLTAEEVRSKLASVEDFSRAGVERQFFLNNLKFTPVIRPDGKSFVRVTSTQAVREPFLNFLLEVYWPAGRVLKEYTLLLDPPMYTPQEVVYQGAPVTTPVATAPASRQPVAAAQQPARPVAPAAPARLPALRDGQYRVQNNDTLWVIAQRSGVGGSVHQVMLAIQDLNPGAFIDGNINKLKSGQLLQMPTAEQVLSRGRGQAVAEFQTQVESWRSGATAERQLDARRRETAAAAPARVEQGDSLRLVAAETGETPLGSDSGSSSRTLENQLAGTKEQLDSALRENEDLASRVEELNSQVEKLQRLLELKNTELANLQTLAEEGLPEDFGVAVDVTEPPVEEVETAQQPVVDVGQQDDAAITDTVTATETTGLAAEQDGETADTEDAQETAAVAPAAAEVKPEPVVESEPAPKAEPEPEPEPAPVVPEPQPEKSFFAELKENPLFLPGAGAGAALLLLLLLFSRRNKAKQEEVLPPEDEGTQAAASGMTDAEDFIVMDDELEAGVVPGDGLAGADQVSAEFVDGFETGKEAFDPIVEAENYISFGRFNQASDVLLKAIDADPQREDLRFKLLEVYADLEDRNAFLQQVGELNAMGVAQGKMDELRQRFPHLMGEEEDFLSLDEINLEMPELGTSDVEQTPFDDLVGASDLLADDIPGLDELLQESTVEEGVKAAGAETAEQDEFSSLLDAVEAELEFDNELKLDSESDDGLTFDADLDLAAGLERDVSEEAAASEAPLVSESMTETTTDGQAGFELPEFEDFNLEDFGLPEVAEGSNELSLDDLQLDTLEHPVAETAAPSLETEQDFELDLSLPLEEPALELSEEFDALALETELESIEAGLDALQDEVGETLQVTGEQQPVEESFEDDLDALLNLDADLDLDIPALARETDGESDVLAALEQELDDDFGFLQGDDEDKTKLDLASAWIDMGDIEGAREILEEVIRDGAEEHQERARELLAKLG